MVLPKAKPRLRTKPRLTHDLREDIFRSGKKLRVDREKGVVYEVKILGLESVNGRRYLAEAARDAIPMYEGIGVYQNHPKQPNDPRECDDRFGWLENVHVGDGGALFGDLHILLPESDLAKKIFKAAEEKPDLFGLSHNAKGEGKEIDGVFVVEQIISVRSVDVVTEPATTGGLQEQRNGKMAIKIKQLFENSWKRYAKKTTKRPKLAAIMKRLVEDDEYDVMDKETEGEEVPADHEAALKEGFRASILHLVDTCLDSGGDDAKECLKKIKELVSAHGKLTGGDDQPEDDMEEEDPQGKEGDKPEGEKKEKEAEEQRKRLRELEAKDSARELCEEMGVACDKVLLEALVALPDARARKRFLEREKGRTPAKGGNGGGARSGADGGNGGGSSGKHVLDTPEAIMAALN